MDLRIPRPILKWIDEQRGNLSREIFIIHKLSVIMNKEMLDKK